ncbi:Uncharacterised protein [Vibrio cholerae]|nr:Uncharacterised protein [Vibrio cholerae]
MYGGVNTEATFICHHRPSECGGSDSLPIPTIQNHTMKVE